MSGPLRPWRTHATRVVYRNPWITVFEHDVTRPNGTTGIYGVVSCGLAAGVVAFVDGDRILMVRQWRFITDRPEWEIPTGKVNPGEPVEAAVRRELEEETGYVVTGDLVPLSSFVSSKSVVDETAHLFVATACEPTGRAGGDETETIEVRPMPFEEVVAMVESGEIVDAMTVIAVLLVARRRSREHR